MTSLRLLSFLAVALSPLLEAAPFTVINTDNNGAGSLRAAVLAAVAAPGDDTITFAAALAGETIVLDTGSLPVTSAENILITAEGLPTPVTISAFGASRIFVVGPGAGLELVDLVLSEGLAPSGTGGSDGETPTDGNSGENGGAIFNEGALVLRRCLVETSAAGNGGVGGDKEGATDVTAGEGGAGGQGGAIYSTGSGASVRIEQSILRQNDAGAGGSAGLFVSGAVGGVGIGGRGGSGGAVFCNGGFLEIVESVIESNRAGAGGGGGGNGNSGPGGTGGRGGDGGGIAVEGAGLVVTDATIRSNSAGLGGFGGDAAGDTDTRGAGGKGGDGGGLFVRNFVSNATAHLSGSLLQSNQAGNGRAGGSSPGLGNGETGTRGGDGGSGGGLFVVGNLGSVWKMRNSTVLLNFAGEGGSGGDGTSGGLGGGGGDAGKGAGIAFSNDGAAYTTVLTHLTILSNQEGLPGQEGTPAGSGDGADSSGGGVWEHPGGINSGPGITLANSVVALNDAATVPNIGPFIAEGNNLTSGDPEVGLLSNNGGPTLTVPPLFGSPLIDGGATLAAPLTTDQRGQTRPRNGLPDLGAFEARFQPDARIGKTSDPATHRIDNVYTLSGVGQTQAVKLVGLRKASFYLSAQNDGEIIDDLRLDGTRANRTLKLMAFNLTAGKTNITAELATGHSLAATDPGEVFLFQFDVKARSRTTRPSQNLSFGVRSSIPSLVDTVRAKVSQQRVRKPRR